MVFSSGLGFAKGRMGERKVFTAEEAIADSEAALDNGRIGDALSHSERLLKTHGLPKELSRRVEMIVARCNLVTGKYGAAEKTFAKLRKAAPEDDRMAEWHARSLDGLGRGDAAFSLLTDLAAKNALTDGDSYWTLAQLERGKGREKEALEHAKQALEKPIVLQSEELEKQIHQFIADLSKKK